MLVKDQPENLPTTNALDNLALPGADRAGVQGALIESAWVKFRGSSHMALDDPPELEVERVYIVKATCRKVETELRKDNEERHTVVMEIDSIYERGKVPIVDENQGSLFDQPDDGEEPDQDVAVHGGPDDEDQDDDTVVRPAFSGAD